MKMNHKLLLLLLGVLGFSVAACTGAPISQPTVAPAAATASVTGTCTLPPDPAPFDANVEGPPTLKYTVTLTNTSSVDDDVAQIGTAFEDASGTEITSDQQYASGVILPGQSLTWSFPLPDQLVSAPVMVGTMTQAQADSANASTGSIAHWAGDEIDSESLLAASCQFAEWYREA